MADRKKPSTTTQRTLTGWVVSYPGASLRLRSCNIGDGVEMVFYSNRDHAREAADEEGDMDVFPATLTWEN